MKPYGPKYSLSKRGSTPPNVSTDPFYDGCPAKPGARDGSPNSRVKNRRKAHVEAKREIRAQLRDIRESEAEFDWRMMQDAECPWCPICDEQAETV
jgi:hypothetical protein